MTGERSADGGGVQGGSDGGRTAPTRRTFLHSAVAVVGLAAGLGTAGAQSTATSDDGGTPTPGEGSTATPDEETTESAGPPAPTGIRAKDPSVSQNVPVLWNAPADPCSADLDHYEVTVDGRDYDTVPAGVERTTVHLDGTATVDVVAVDAAGNRSPPATATIENHIVVDPAYTIGADPSRDSVAVGETVAAQVGLDAALGGPSGGEISGVTVSVSTPCVATITGASAGDGGEPTVADDGTAATFPAGVDLSSTSIELTGHARGGTLLRVSSADPDEDIDAVPVPTTLRVTDPGPPAPTNLRSKRPRVSTSVRVFWDGPADPCGADLDHYVVTVDGSEHETVPVGVRQTAIPTEGTATVGVTAVDADGNESETVTTEIQNDLVTDPAYTVFANPARDAVAVGETVQASIDVREILGGASIGDPSVTVTTSTPCVATITGASAGSGSEPTVADDGTAVTFPADVDLSTATLELTGHATGGTVLGVSTEDPDGYDRLTPVPGRLTVVESSLPPVAGESAPRDLDDDGVHEDLNANGRFDSDDVVAYFEHLDDPALTEHAGAYDPNGNDRIDFDDVVQLFQQL